MKSKQKRNLIIMLGLAVVFLVGALLIGSNREEESISEVMKDAVLHEHGKVNFLGIMEVNPALYSAMIVTAVLLVFALIVRIFVIPKFKMVPGKIQLVLETWVGFFDGLAKTNSPHRNKFLGFYLFAAGSYIFTSTIYELFGLQVITTHGTPLAMPAPLSDINAAICMGVMSYCIIMSGGIAGNGVSGIGKTLKDFSIPISMSFRLFGALLSGLLVTELVYYTIKLSIVLPVVVAVLFTLIHALIQTYVLTFLTALFYGEVSEVHEKASKENKHNKVNEQAAA